jgi:methionyl-tRNA formyltransferase
VETGRDPNRPAGMEATEGKIRVAALLNWGIGCEVLKTLHRMDDVRLGFVVTRDPATNTDPWAHSVRDFAGDIHCPCVDETRVPFDELRTMVLDGGVDLIVCHAYRLILPRRVFETPRLGSLNIHCSLLPKYRGPSPHHWVLKNRERETGITYHMMDEGIDSGPVAHQVVCEVCPEDGIDALLDRLKALIAPSLPEAIRKLADPAFRPLPQNHELASYAPRP